MKKLIQNFGNNNTILATKEGKRSFISQMVSHCNAESGRDELTRMIQKFIPVDVYGACGPFHCKKRVCGPSNCNGADQSCYKMMERKYKFYLSFENSICADYVTEKYFNILPRNIIPVVFNGANMSDLAPLHSHINVMDYRSVRDLVKEMKKIAEDDALFASFFWWRDYYRVQVRHHLFRCNSVKFIDFRINGKFEMLHSVSSVKLFMKVQPGKDL